MSKQNGKKPRQNTSVARDERGRWLKGTPSPNPGGRHKNEVSLDYWLREFLVMPPDEIATYLQVYLDEFERMGKTDAPMVAIIVARALLTLANETEGRLFATILDRIDGKMPQGMEIFDWRKKLSEHGYDAAAVFERVTQAAYAALVGTVDGGSSGGS